MSMPTLTDTGQRLYDALAPLAVEDAENHYDLAHFCAGLAVMADPVANIVRDDSLGRPGWAPVFDVANVDPSWLPWLGQFVGVNLTGVTSVASQRALIEHPTGFKRGDAAALKVAIQQTLTGTQTVYFNERAGGPWNLNIATLTSETPNASQTAAVIAAQVPAWLVVTYTTVSGGTYAILAASHATYSAMEAAHTSYDSIRTNPSA